MNECVLATLTFGLNQVLLQFILELVKNPTCLLKTLKGAFSVVSFDAMGMTTAWYITLAFLHCTKNPSCTQWWALWDFERVRLERKGVSAKSIFSVCNLIPAQRGEMLAGEVNTYSLVLIADIFSSVVTSVYFRLPFTTQTMSCFTCLSVSSQ